MWTFRCTIFFRKIAKISKIFRKFSSNLVQFRFKIASNWWIWTNLIKFTPKGPHLETKNENWKSLKNFEIFRPYTPKISLFIRFLRKKFSKFSPAAPKTPHFRRLRRRKCGLLGAPKSRFCGTGPPLRGGPPKNHSVTYIHNLRRILGIKTTN